jgi:PEP-CTERM motif
MPRNTQTLNCQRRTNKFRIGFALASLLLTIGSSSVSRAATIQFTIQVPNDVFVAGAPSLSTPTLPIRLLGSGSFAPLGSVTYSEAGTITFAMLPSGEFVPSLISDNFTASFNGGANTFTGTDIGMFGASTVTGNLTILGGTGIFSGATGFATVISTMVQSSGNPDPDFAGTFAASGSGQITAPGLTAVPEPTTMTLLGIAMAGLVGLAAIQKKRHHLTADK